MWIVDDVGEERDSFKMSFRELCRLATIQKLDLVAKQVEQLQKKKAFKNGGGAQGAFRQAWESLSGPVKVNKTLITVDDFRIANEHYALICDRLNKGKHKSCKALC